MPEQVVTLVRLPIKEAVEMLRKKHHISEAFSEVRLEDEFLAFYFVRPSVSAEILETEAGVETVSTLVNPAPRKRKARKRRNRMKTRGWAVVGKIVNRQGQTAMIYKPFVDALSSPGMSRREQLSVVEQILRKNRNRPSEASIEYFLNNSLEYLKRRPEAATPQE